MKVVLITNYITSIPVLQKLGGLNQLLAVIAVSDKNEFVDQIESVSKSINIPFQRLNPSDFDSQIKVILRNVNPDIVLVYNLKKKISLEILDIPKYGFLNVHYSLLPLYKGSDPLFWQLKNGEKSVGISIHKMDKDFDTGELVNQMSVPVYPGENYGLLSSRLSLLSIDLICGTININDLDNAKPQDKGLSYSYFKAPKPIDLRINWEQQNSEEIAFLVNATNPNYGGALTSLNGAKIYIMEVTPADEPENNNLPPGSIIFSDNQYGVFVICKGGGALRIDIVRTQEAFLSGFKLAALGINTNHRFI